MNEADAVLCLVVLVVLSRVRQFSKHQTWAAVSATRGDHVGGIVETHHRVPHSAFLSAELSSCCHTICYSRSFA